MNCPELNLLDIVHNMAFILVLSDKSILDQQFNSEVFWLEVRPIWPDLNSFSQFSGSSDGRKIYSHVVGLLRADCQIRKKKMVTKYVQQEK